VGFLKDEALAAITYRIGQAGRHTIAPNLWQMMSGCDVMSVPGEAADRGSWAHAASLTALEPNCASAALLSRALQNNPRFLHSQPTINYCGGAVPLHASTAKLFQGSGRSRTNLL
jgi:hypothetical protein